METTYPRWNTSISNPRLQFYFAEPGYMVGRVEDMGRRPGADKAFRASAFDDPGDARSFAFEFDARAWVEDIPRRRALEEARLAA